MTCLYHFYSFLRSSWTFQSFTKARSTHLKLSTTYQRDSFKTSCAKEQNVKPIELTHSHHVLHTPFLGGSSWLHQLHQGQNICWSVEQLSIHNCPKRPKSRKWEDFTQTELWNVNSTSCVEGLVVGMGNHENLWQYTCLGIQNSLWQENAVNSPAPAIRWPWLKIIARVVYPMDKMKHYLNGGTVSSLRHSECQVASQSDMQPIL